jgi:flagellin-like protein
MSKHGENRTNRKQPKKRKALSPVVSTLILTAVTLTISLSTTLWARGTGGALTGFEKIECLSAAPDYDSESRTWTVLLTVRNVGTRSSTISSVYVNEVELRNQEDKPTPGNGGANIPVCGLVVNQGAEVSFSVYLRHGGNGQVFSKLVGEQTLFIRYVTLDGLECTKICQLWSVN